MTQTFAFLVIFFSANAGLFGLAWPSIFVASLALWSISLYEHRRYRARFAAAGMGDIFNTFAISNAGVSFVACGAGYLLGCLVRQIALS